MSTKLFQELKNDYRSTKKMKIEISKVVSMHEKIYSEKDELGIEILKQIEKQEKMLLEAIARIFYKRLFYSFGLDLLLFEAYKIEKNVGLYIEKRLCNGN